MVTPPWVSLCELPQMLKADLLQYINEIANDLTDKELDIEPLIIAAIDNIGKIEENIEVQNGMSSRDVDRYEKWKKENIPSQIFEYEGNYFRIGFWIS